MEQLWFRTRREDWAQRQMDLQVERPLEQLVALLAAALGAFHQRQVQLVGVGLAVRVAGRLRRLLGRLPRQVQRVRYRLLPKKPGSETIKNSVTAGQSQPGWIRL